MSFNIALPNITGLSEEEQLAQTRRYLYQLAEQLNFALNSIDGGVEEKVVKQIQQAASKPKTKEEAQASFNDIKALIITSADVVNAYYEEINKKLSGLYVAESEFGTFVEETRNNISANSTGINQYYENTQTVIGNLASELGGVKENVDSLSGSYTYVSSRVDSVSGELTNVSGRVDSVSGEITNVSGRVDAVSGEITEVSDRVASVSGDLSGVSGRVEEVSGRVESVNTDLSGKFESVSGEVSEVSGRVDTVSGNVTAVSNQLGEVSGTLSQVSDKANAVEAGLDKATTETQTALGDLSSELGGVKENTDKLSGDISGVTERVGTVEGSIDGLTTELGNVDGKVNGVSDRLDSAENALSEVEIYVKTTKANIKSGLLYYDDEGTPIYGVEVGQENEINGVTVFRKYARFISNRLSFYDENDNEVAYISDRKLYITDVEVTGSYKIGGLRDYVRTSGSVVTKYVGS